MASSTRITKTSTDILARLQEAYNALRLPSTTNRIAFYTFAEEHMQANIDATTQDTTPTEARFFKAEQLAFDFGNKYGYLWSPALKEWDGEKLEVVGQALLEYFLALLQIPVFRRANVGEAQVVDQVQGGMVGRMKRSLSEPREFAPTTGRLRGSQTEDASLEAEFRILGLGEEDQDEEMEGGEHAATGGKSGEWIEVKGKKSSRPGKSKIDPCPFCGEEFGSVDEVTVHVEWTHPIDDGN